MLSCNLCAEKTACYSQKHALGSSTPFPSRQEISRRITPYDSYISLSPIQDPVWFKWNTRPNLPKEYTSLRRIWEQAIVYAQLVNANDHQISAKSFGTTTTTRGQIKDEDRVCYILWLHCMGFSVQKCRISVEKSGKNKKKVNLITS